MIEEIDLLCKRYTHVGTDMLEGGMLVLTWRVHSLAQIYMYKGTAGDIY